MMILAIVQDTPERYENIQKLLNSLGIGSLAEQSAFWFVGDYKVYNQTLGLCAHGGDHCCPFCTVSFSLSYLVIEYI